MTLNSLSTYPSTRSYVLKLHRDATPERDHLAGRLENMASGRHFDFGSADELLACLTEDLKSTDVEQAESL
jgi:hypothetical protein